MNLITHWGFYLVIILENVFYFGSFEVKFKLIELPNVDSPKSIKN